MKNFTKFLIPVMCGAATLMGFNANAFQDNPEGCYAMEVIDFQQGLDKNGNAVATDRSDPTKALMEPDRSNAPGGFFTLGFGGSITLKLAGAVLNGDGPDLKIWETTFAGDSCTNTNQETASIEVSDGVTWVNAGDVCRDGMIDLDGLAIPYVTYVRITDLGTSPNDGYDVDGLEALYGCIDFEDEDFCYGSTVVEGSFMQGLKKNGQPVAANRSDASKTLGQPELVYDPNVVTYTSLGYGGSIVIAFDGVVYDAAGDDILVAETTGTGAGATAGWIETAEVFVSQDNVVFYSVGFANKFEQAQFDIADAGAGLTFIRSVKVVDVTPMNSTSADAYDLDGIIALNGCSEDPFEEPEICNNFDYFVADRQEGGSLNIYAAKTVGGSSVLTYITSRNPAVSIAYDEANNVLYGINSAGSVVEKISPFNGASLGTVNVASGFGGSVFGAVYKNGFLYASSGSQNRVVAIDVTDGSYTEVVSGLPISGGDLAFIGDDLYISTKDGDDLFKFIGGDPINVGYIPADIHGISATPDGNLAVIAKNSNEIRFLDTNGNMVSSMSVILNGEPFTLNDGDMTGGCNIPFNEEDPNPAGCYVADYFNYVEGTTKNGGEVDDIRTNPDMVLGEPEGTDEYVFTTLGYNGEITLTFGGAVLNIPGPDLFFVETSFNKPLGCETYPEYADIYVSLDGIEYFMAGTICKSENMIDISEAGNFDYINYVKVVNNNDMSTTPDGYDLDGVVALGNCAEFDMATFLANQQAALSANQLEANDLGFVSYPNPTTGISNVEFVAKTSGKVLIEVYDINGRNIAQVFNGETFAGQQYKADFNGSNLSSGLYIYKITTNNTSITEKFIISK